VDPLQLPSGSGYASEFEVMLYEFKAGINAYLADLGPSAPVRTLKDIIEFNEQHAHEEMPWFKQETLIKADAKGPLTEQAYLDALAKCRKASRENGVDALMDKNQLDVVLQSGGGPAPVIDYVYGDGNSGGGSPSLPAIAGYPSISVPAGFIAGMPVSIFLFGRAWSEPTLLRIAFAFEQATKGRRPPQFLPTISPGF